MKICSILLPKKKTIILSWSDTYQTDPNTSSIFLHIQSTQKKWTTYDLYTIHTGYKTALKEHRVKIIKVKLVLLKPVLSNSQQLTLIIVPKPLERKIFSHFHAVPTSFHMGEYKTLYRMRIRFFWTGLRTDVTAWVKGCARCLSYNVWRNWKQELHFY